MWQDNAEKFDAGNYNDNKISRLFSQFNDDYTIKMRFNNREAAAHMMASTLKKYKNSRSSITVIAIARGGMIIGDAIARKLSVNDFDIVVPRKLGSKDNLENAVGAIMQDCSIYLDNSV